MSDISTTSTAKQYTDMLIMVTKMARRMHDTVKDEFKRLRVIEINAAQGLLLFNIGDDEVTAGEMTSRGYYQGVNVSHNLKKLTELSYLDYQQCKIDRRSIKVRLTEKGQEIRQILGDLFARHQAELADRELLGDDEITEIVEALYRIEQY